MPLFPDLSRAPKICLDIEGRDERLKELGPGEFRDGYMTGIALATNDGFREYYPFRHAEGDNLDEHRVLGYLREQLRHDNDKVGANLKYDVSYLMTEGVQVGGRLRDVQLAEPLIDENARSYSLDTLSVKYLNEHKLESSIEEYCRQRGWKGKPQAHIWKMPGHIVAPYAKGDVDLPLRILEKQEKILLEQDLMPLFDMETDLLRVVIMMRQIGVRVNHERASEVEQSMLIKLAEAQSILDGLAGRPVNFNSSADLSVVFDKAGLSYNRTPKGAPSFTKPFLEHHPSDIARAVIECRKLAKFIGTFIQSTILNHTTSDSRIHCSFNQLRADDYGTVTGRFSSSNPNLQFIPARDKILGPMIRSMFIPEEGCRWGRADYSQIELRILAHYGMGTGSNELREAFLNNPRMDLHQWGADVVGIERKPAKTINFGVVYGMGSEKMANELGLELQAAKDLIKKYHKKLPFLKATSNKAMEAAASRGHVYTIMKRRRRFNLWEPADFKLSREVRACLDRDEMEETVARIRRERVAEGRTVPRPGVKRAATYKALNAVIQGSAADVMKMSMVDNYKAGLFGYPGCTDKVIPHLTVHDELDVSVPMTKEGEEAFREMTRRMENVYKFEVPLIVDPEIGENWGYCEPF